MPKFNGAKLRGALDKASEKARRRIESIKYAQTSEGKLVRAKEERAKWEESATQDQVLKEADLEQLKSMQEAKEAERQRKLVEREIFDEKYGHITQTAQKAGRTAQKAGRSIAKGAASLTQDVGKAVAHLTAVKPTAPSTHVLPRTPAPITAAKAHIQREDVQSFLEAEDAPSLDFFDLEIGRSKPSRKRSRDEFDLSIDLPNLEL